MEKHLICSDLDGTLLSSDQMISQKNKQILRDLIADGHYFTVATGRLFTMARFFAESVHKEAGVIASNGAIAISGSSKVLYKAQIKPEVLLEIYRICQSEDMLVSFFSENTVYSSKERKRLRKTSDAAARVAAPSYKLVERETDFLQIIPEIVNGIVIEDDGPKRIGVVRELLEKVNGLTCLSSHANNIELLPEGHDKRLAVRELARELHVKPENVIAFGDGENDLGMLREAGIGVAMKNADHFVKKQADAVTKSNDRDGVYHFLKSYFYK